MTGCNAWQRIFYRREIDLAAGIGMGYRGKRPLDVVFAGLALIVAIVPMVLLALLVKLSSRGPVLYWSLRVGKNNRLFRMPKLRTMRADTPARATHLLDQPEQYLTPLGGFLRKSSLDELPQIWSILVGDMSWVGPRPALFNQNDLVALRTEMGVHQLVPGLTGWAQINGRDDLPIPQKAALDAAYRANISFALDLFILRQTLLKVLRGDGVAH